MTRSRSRILALLTGSLAAAAVVATSRNTPRVVAAAPRSPAMSAGILPPPNTSVPAGVVPKSSRELPPLSVAGEQKVDARVRALAEELRSRWTRNPDQLVAVIDDASRSAASSPPVTLLLAIAHAETNGKILEVSEAGAVGLAQATPVAYLQERFDGRLFVTADYLDGARAYVTKKPLGDAYRIASLASRKDVASRRRAAELLPAARRLRREGYEELQALRPHADARFYATVEDADLRNQALLEELERLIARDDRPALKAYEQRVRIEYNRLREQQVVSWQRYYKELIARRDALLVARFGLPARDLGGEAIYEASEYLGAHLDDRFSATHMAAFLVRHLETKSVEARSLAAAEEQVEEMTAALYNGGALNVKRILAGLMASLPETEKYMKKVPATRRDLDARVAAVTSEPAEPAGTREARLAR